MIALPSARPVCGRRVRGFTLIEVLVALSVGAMLLLAARVMVEQLAMTSGALARVQREHDDAAARTAVLRSLAFQVETDSVDGFRFQGYPDRAQFASWCDMPGGWQEPCSVTLSVAGDTTVVYASATTGTISLRPNLGPVRLQYLAQSKQRLSWIDVWDASLVPPLAIGLVSPRDTTILRIGVRR